MMEGGVTSVGERLLRSAEVERAAHQVAREVEQQVAGARAGPVGTAVAVLQSALPRAFIGVGAAITTAHAAVSAGDEVRAAAALLCAQELLFPADLLGRAAVAGAVRLALESVEEYDGAPPVEDGEAVQRRVAQEVEALERCWLRVGAQVLAAALGTYAWKRLTGGMGVAADVAASHGGLFVNGLARWAFLAEAALEGVRKDNWIRVGAAVVAARRVTSSSA